MQRPGSHVLFSVWSLSLVVGPAKVPHPLLTSQVLDRLRLGWVSVSLRRRKVGVVWPNAAAGSTTNQIQGRVMLLKNLLPVLLLALQTQPKPCERCAMKIYFTKTVPLYQTLTLAPSLAMESVQDFTLPWVETAWVEPRGITSMAVRCRT